jgi:hypothetical protein
VPQKELSLPLTLATVNQKNELENKKRMLILFSLKTDYLFNNAIFMPFNSILIHQ